MFISLRPHGAVWITALVMLLIALASPVEAQQRGQLVLDRGLVKVSNGPKVRIYNVPGTTVLLSVDDQVHTARNSAARVILSSGDEVVTLQANTVFKVENESNEESNTRLLTGNLNIEVNPNRALINGRKRPFKVRTVTAVVGVRGTNLETSFDPATGETETTVLEGTVTVEVAELEGDESAAFPVEAGQSMAVKPDGIRPPGAVEFSPVEKAVTERRETYKKEQEIKKQEQQQRQQQQQSQNQGQGQPQQKTQQQSQGQPQQKPGGQQQQSQSQGQRQQQQQSQSQPQQGGPSQAEGQPPPQQQGEGQPPQEGPPPGASGEEPPSSTEEGPGPVEEEPSPVEEGSSTEEAPDLPEEELPPVEEPVIEEVEVEEVFVEEIEIEEVDLGDLEAITDQINEQISDAVDPEIIETIRPIQIQLNYQE